MANGIKGFLSNPMASYTTARQPGGFLAPAENFKGYFTNPMAHAGSLILQGEPIGKALLGGAIQAKELEKTMFPEADILDTKRAMNPLTGEIVFATEAQIQNQGLVPVPDDPTSYQEYVRQTDNPTTEGYAEYMAKKSGTATTATYSPPTLEEQKLYNITPDTHQINTLTNKVENITKASVGSTEKFVDLDADDVAKYFGGNEELSRLYQKNKDTGRIVKITETAQAPKMFESAEEKAIGGAIGADFANIVERADTALAQNDALDQLEFYITSINPEDLGGLARWKEHTTKFLKAIGLDTNLTEDLAYAEAISSIGGDLVVASLANFKGAISDAEREFLQRITPGLGMTQEGSLQLIYLRKKANNRMLDIEALAYEHLNDPKTGGTLSKRNSKGLTFDQVKREYIKENPIFDETAQKEIEKLSGMGIQGATAQGGHCINGRMVIKVGQQYVDTGAC